MRGTVVGVLRGGPSREYEVSLASGHAIIANLPKEHFTVRDIYIDKQGVWHERGRPVTPHRALHSLDVVVIGLHGEYGEDGEVQKLLEKSGVPYTGSDSFSSFVAMHKVLSKERAKQAGLKTPNYYYIEESTAPHHMEHMLREVVRTWPQPVVVKPTRWGSSVGVTMTTGYAPLHTAVTGLLAQGAGGVLVEEYVKGTEATAGVVEEMRGEKLYALPPVEIIPPSSDFFSYEAKYSGISKEVCPGRFDKQVQAELERQARVMHDALGLRHYSRSDFIVTPKGIYYLETNSLPGLTNESLLLSSLSAVGISFSDFLSHIVALARAGKKR
ncbi:MAG: D-alanine-D-alanine ligase [Parcubacteria bacterium C7867-007]|nr:MAG: D-alanine-D-alanine ligase [Parcubacteria bacterium C7867-007]